ncbi:hypothetical protein D3C83_236600 [compost metagenome]
MFRLIALATISTIAALPSMPVLVASTLRSPPTASICCSTCSGVRISECFTPVVFCAVTAVIADEP